ncbi:hypothetical protein [Chelativorans sp. AA-79]|uniref:hypothetical protein n=1 Tax=Chelativorans sp. AA-79 TaxID=3028735 RepID=UPI0023F877FE|nr:hypothetical protein [Chelativorans sp. AA-79]WEX10763.1 hypothetical protein PVE73_07455 [Chelativorans sp. AA-79]
MMACWSICFLNGYRMRNGAPRSCATMRVGSTASTQPDALHRISNGRTTMKRVTRMGFAAFVLAVTVAASDARELTYDNHLPPQHPVNVAMEDYFERVKTDTDGSLDFKMYVGGALGGGNALLGILRDGLSDAGMLNPVYDPSQLKVTALLSELMIADPRVLVGAMNEMVNLDCPGCADELLAVNAIPIMSFAVPSFQLLCNQPLKSLDDAKGKRVRAVGSLALIAKDFGMVPVNLKSDEVYEGLQRGQVECAAAPFDWLETNNLKEVADNLITTPLGAIGGLLHLAVNTNAWEAMSDEEKRTMIDATPETLAAITFAYIAGSEKALENSIAAGAEAYPMGDDMHAVLEAFRAEEVDRIVAKGDDLGITDTPHLFEIYRNLIEKWEGIVAGPGSSEEGYAEALRQEIYSKL